MDLSNAVLLHRFQRLSWGVEEAAEEEEASLADILMLCESAPRSRTGDETRCLMSKAIAGRR